jgi:hypothetical protein
MNLCDLVEQECPEICSYDADVARQTHTNIKINKILDRHLFDVEAALQSELKAWEIWERVNAGKR